MKKILIIDDEELIVKVLSLRLEGEGYEVMQSYDGNDGLDKAIKFKPDLAIVDLGLPKVDGNTICDVLKKNEKTKGIKIIILTGKKLMYDMEKAFESGADAYISKPYEFPLLLQKIKKLIG
ncbi:MAG: response regulator [Elusimicrobiota bacterium]